MNSPNAKLSATLAALDGYVALLALKLTYGDPALFAPSPLVQRMWLAHVTDVPRYTKMCRALLGETGGVFQYAVSSSTLADAYQLTLTRLDELGVRTKGVWPNGLLSSSLATIEGGGARPRGDKNSE